MAFVAPNAGLPVPVGVARPDTVKLVAYRVFFHAIAAIARFPAGERVVAGASFCFFVGGIIITGIGVGAVAIGFREPPPCVLVRGCFPIGTPAIQAHLRRCAIRFLKVAAVCRFGVAGIALAGMGVGFISVGCPSAPVMPRRVIPAAHGAGGRPGAGRCAEGTILRFDVVAFILAGAGVGAVAVGLPLAPVVRPVFTVGRKTRSTFRQFRARGFVLGCICLLYTS